MSPFCHALGSQVINTQELSEIFGKLTTILSLRDAAVKQKLERAIKEMESPKKPITTTIPRGLRRSISMSEITPAAHRQQHNTKLLVFVLVLFSILYSMCVRI